MTIWLTADLHLGHARVIEHCNRPFASSQSMDCHILDTINSLVLEGDTLWILGDFCWHNPGYYRDKIRCKNMGLVWGNHDGRHKKELATVVQWSDNLKMIKEDKKELVLCHYAMKTWPKKHRGVCHLFGHSHGTLQDPEPGSMDVGWDVWGRPLKFNEAREVILERWKEYH